MHRDIRLLITNTGLILGSRSLIIVSRGIYAIVLARMLGPEIYGLYNYGLSWYLAFMPLAFWGIGFILSREIGKNRNLTDQCARIVVSLFTMRVATSFIAALACLVVGLLIEDDRNGEFLVACFALALLGRSLAIWCSEVFVAHEKAELTFKLQSACRLLEVALGIALLYLGYGLVAIVALHVCSWWLEAVLGFIVVRSRFAESLPALSSAGNAAFVRQGLPLALMDICSTWFMVGPVVVYRHMSSDAASLGELTFSLQIFFMLVTVIAAFSIAVLPLMSRLGAEQAGLDFKLSFISYKLGLMFSSLFTILGTALAVPLTALLLTGEYKETSSLIAVALWLSIPIAGSAPLQQRLIAAGRDGPVLYTNAAGVVLMTVLIPFLIRDFAALGAIISAGAGLLLTLLLQVGIFIGRDGPVWVVVSLKAGAALLLSHALVSALAFSGSWLGPLLSVIALLFLFGLFVFSREERGQFLSGLGFSAERP
jgi:O-antigen/teichoic acid export membrane protein